MFLLEAMPAILLGIVAGIYLPDNPKKAPWLRLEEKEWLGKELEREHLQTKNPTAKLHSKRWWSKPRLWGFALVYFGLNCCTYGISLWLPSTLKFLSGFPNLLLGFLSAVPYLVAATTMVLVGAHSDRTMERRWHIALSAFSGAWRCSLRVGERSHRECGGFFHCVGGFVFDERAVLGDGVEQGDGSYGRRNHRRSSIPLAILAAAIGPYWIGYLRQTTGSFRGGLLSVAIMLALAGFTILRLDRPTPGNV